MNETKAFQPIIKWSGSKRKVAYQLTKMFPDHISTYYDPFLGGGSMLYATDAKMKFASDINKPLIDLWKLIQKEPNFLLESYTKNWNELNEDENPNSYKTFFKIRENFNKYKKPEDLFFLSRTCVNGLIRFNKAGEFNNSLHYTRKGINPKRLEQILNLWVKKVKNVKFSHLNYIDTLSLLKQNDFVYLDPPYFNTKSMYYGAIDIDEFLNFLELLNNKGIKFLLSFDGKTSDKDYTFEIPKELYKKHDYIHTGASTFKKVIDKKSNIVHESIYMNY